VTNACVSDHAPQVASIDVAQLMAMINGAWVTQVIRADCVLGLPEHLSQHAADVSTLAAASGCNVAALRRLLLAMAALELCEPVIGDGWRLTSRGRLLCTPDSLHHWTRHAGGGLWQRLGAVLRRAPAAYGILQDQAAALAGAAESLERFGVAARCRIEVGDFFVGVPAGADLYLLKSVLHNWEDESCRLVLARCFDAMSPQASLLVIERLRPDAPGHGPRDREVARTDMNMLVSLSGQERSRGEYALLFADACLCLESVREAGAAHWSVLEARRDPARA
jgi:hypothetical protein